MMTSEKIKVTFECVSGGHGWGKTGSIVALVFSKPMSDTEYLLHAPGGWVIKSKEVYND